jgi:uncharacterized protein (DUF1778 family)
MAFSNAEGEKTLSNVAQKNARLELRSTHDQKVLIEKAASLMGQSVTSFVLSNVLKDAMEVITKHQITELSLNDWTRFNTVREADLEPNEALVEAMKNHKNRVLNSDGF